MLTRMAARQWPMSKKNGRIMFGHYLNTVDEPRSELPDAPRLFLVGREYTREIFLTSKNLNFNGYTCRWILKLHQFLYFSYIESHFCYNSQNR